MTNKIYPCLWFDGKAKEAAQFYCTVFEDARITTDTPMVVNFEIYGKKMMGLNGGPMFKITPAISLFVTCETDEEIEQIWNKLAGDGNIMMPLDKYPWSQKYGWVADRYGMTWQLMLGNMPASGQKITTSFLFTGEQFGMAQEAMNEYTSLFPGSKIHNVQLYGAGGNLAEGKLEFGQFSLADEMFVAMDGPGDHHFTFTEGLSIVVMCETQEEIDHYWNKLTEGGQESRCGWLKDRYGVSWQIVPTVLEKLMSNSEQSGKVMQAFMSMKKFDIEALVKASDA